MNKCLRLVKKRDDMKRTRKLVAFSNISDYFSGDGGGGKEAAATVNCQKGKRQLPIGNR